MLEETYQQGIKQLVSEHVTHLTLSLYLEK